MKKHSLKIVVGMSALIISIVMVWASSIIQILIPESEKSFPPLTTNEELTRTFPTTEESGKVVIGFKGFELYKDWVAKFEITNYTAKPITYIGFKTKREFDFCTLAAKRDEIYKPTGVITSSSGTTTKYHCRESKAVILQTIEPNEKVLFSVFKMEVQNLVTLREEYKNAKIGFEFFVDDEKRREILWSEDITFPDDAN